MDDVIWELLADHGAPCRKCGTRIDYDPEALRPHFNGVCLTCQLKEWILLHTSSTTGIYFCGSDYTTASG